VKSEDTAKSFFFAIASGEAVWQSGAVSRISTLHSSLSTLSLKKREKK